MTRKEEKELSRLRRVPWRRRTDTETRRLLELNKKAKPFNAMPKQAKR